MSGYGSRTFEFIKAEAHSFAFPCQRCFFPAPFAIVEVFCRLPKFLEYRLEIYVGDFACTSTERELETLFSVHGVVKTVHLVTDRYTRQSKCFGSIEMQQNKRW